MLERRSKSHRNSEQQVRSWLIWLADQLARRGQQQFYLEHIQPDWATKDTKDIQRIIALATGIIYGLLLSLMMWFACSITIGWSDTEIVPLEWLILLSNFLIGFVGGAFLVAKLDKAIIFTPVEVVSWSWEHVVDDFWLLWQSVTKKRWFLFVQQGVRAFIGIQGAFLFYNRTHSFPLALLWILGGGWLAGYVLLFYYALHGALHAGWSSTMLAKEKRLSPNEGIRRSFHKGVLVVLVDTIFMLISYMPVVLVMQIIFPSGLASIIFWITTVLTVALYAGFNLGGIVCIMHWIVRLYLWRAGDAPLRYVGFLNYATERILLRRVGGGYMFVHRLLLEYFAGFSPHEEDTDLLASPPTSSSTIRAGVVPRKSQVRRVRKQRHMQSRKKP